MTALVLLSLNALLIIIILTRQLPLRPTQSNTDYPSTTTFVEYNISSYIKRLKTTELLM